MFLGTPNGSFKLEPYRNPPQCIIQVYLWQSDASTTLLGRSVPDHLPYRLESGRPKSLSKFPRLTYTKLPVPHAGAPGRHARCQNCLHVLRGVLFTSTYWQWSNFSHTLSLRGRLASGFVDVSSTISCLMTLRPFRVALCRFPPQRGFHTFSDFQPNVTLHSDRLVSPASVSSS